MPREPFVVVYEPPGLQPGDRLEVVLGAFSTEAEAVAFLAHRAEGRYGIDGPADDAS